MKKEHKDTLKNRIEKELGREATLDEIGNMEGNISLTVKICLEKIEELEERFEKLEDKVK